LAVGSKKIMKKSLEKYVISSLLIIAGFLVIGISARTIHAKEGADDNLFEAIPQTISTQKDDAGTPDKGKSEEAGDDNGGLNKSSDDTHEAEVNDADLVAGTSGALSSAVSSIVKKMDGVSEGDYCETLEDAVYNLSVKQRASLAWYTTSYSKNLSLDASEEASNDEKEQYESLKKDYDKVNTLIFSDDNLASNNKAVIRAAYLDLMASYRNGAVDEARVNRIRDFLHKATDCMKDGSVEIKAAVGEASADEPQETITFSRDELTQEDMGKGFPVAASVKNKNALKDYVKLVIASDDHIKSVTTNETQTETVYTQRGKFLGFIPVWMNVKSTVSADGSAKVRYPWYKFMTSAVGGRVTSDLVLDNVEMPKGDKLTASNQAEAVYATIKAFMSVEVPSVEESIDASIDESAKVETGSVDLETLETQ
jgi:hypothetical protein